MKFTLKMKLDNGKMHIDHCKAPDRKTAYRTFTIRNYEILNQYDGVYVEKCIQGREDGNEES